MPNNKWNDESIEDLLKGFPEIKDNRSKEQVFKNLNDNVTAHKRPKKWLPILVAALAMITVGLLISSIIKQNGMDSAQYDTKTTSEMEDSASMTRENSNASDDLQAEESTVDESEQFSAAQLDETVRIASDENATIDQTMMTIGLTENAIVVPVTFLIPNEKIRSDFDYATPTTLELYQKYADDIDETALGFDEYHPYLGTFKETNNSLLHFLPKDHQYDKASASIGVYINTLLTTFKDAEQIELLNEDGSVVAFSQIGPVESLKPTEQHQAFFTFTTTDGQSYLAPDYDQSFDSASEAIYALTESPNDLFKSPIPNEINFQTTETTELVQIQLEKDFNLESLDSLAALRLIESFTLTAQTFGKKVEVNGLYPESWNGFDFTQPLPLPTAPNVMEWPVE